MRALIPFVLLATMAADCTEYDVHEIEDPIKGDSGEPEAPAAEDAPSEEASDPPEGSEE